MTKFLSVLAWLCIFTTLAAAQTPRSQPTVSWSQVCDQRVEMMNQGFYSEAAPGFKANLLPEWPEDDDLRARAAPIIPRLDLSQGKLYSVDSPLSVAIEGEGFFVVQDDLGAVFYTRCGNLSWKDEALETPEGKRVQVYPLSNDGQLAGKMGPMRLPLDPMTRLYGAKYMSYEVDPQGRICGVSTFTDPVTGQQASSKEPLASFALVTFPHPEQLARVGNTEFAATAGSGPALASMSPAVFRGGQLEAGNNAYYRLAPAAHKEWERRGLVRRGTVIALGQLDAGIQIALQERGLTVAWSDHSGARRRPAPRWIGVAHTAYA